MTYQKYHPITPPPELVQQWLGEYFGCTVNGELSASERYLASKAARWGSAQELEACIRYFHEYDSSWGESSELISGLRTARRPNPPSLKEQAKFAAAVLRSPDETCSIAELQQHWQTICNALEQLDD